MADANADFLQARFGGAPVSADPNTAYLQSVFGGAPRVPAGPRTARDIGDAFVAGLQDKTLGLALRGKLPDVALGEESPWYYRAAAGVGGLISDAPAMVVGGVLGLAAGSPAGPGGAVVGAGAGSFGVPMAIREALIQSYSGGHATSAAGVWEIAKAGLKGAVIGGATAGAGRFVGAALPATTGAMTRGSAVVGAELTTMTTTAAALEGRAPTAQDFMDNAILLVGMKGAIKAATGLRNIYAQTGKTPQEVAIDVARDPALKAELEKSVELPKQYAPAALEQRIKASLDADQRPAVAASLMKMEKDPNAKIESPVRYDYIFDKETADGVVASIAEVYKADIAQQTRGVVPTRQSVAEGVAAIREGELASPREIGAADNSGIVAARAMLAKGAAENAQKLAETLPRDPAAWSLEQKLQWAGAMEQTAMLYAQYRGAGAEAARSLNMFWQMKRDPSLLGNAEQMVKLYERDAKQGDFATMAAIVRSFKDPEQVRAFAETLHKPSMWARLIEPWRAGIFSGPLTWSANLSGNVAKWMVELPESVLTASITAGRQAIKGDPLSMAQYKARAFAPLYGAQLAALDAIHLVAEGKKLVETNGWVEGAKKGAKATAERLSKEDDRIDIYKRANQPGADNIVESAAGYFASAAFGMLKLQDMPFRTVGERAETYKMAVDRATKEGWHPATREWTEALAKYTQNPEIGLTAEAAAKATERIQQAGAKAVFSERLGPLTEKLSAAISGTPWEFLFPARRTPANLLSWAVQHTPGLNLFSGRWREDFAAGGERTDVALARVAIGTALAATAYSMVSEGAITGGGLMDKEQAGTKTGAGWQPYSVKVNGEYYSIQRIEPVAKVLMLTADLHEILNSPKIGPEDKGKVAAMLALAFGNATVSTTYLSGLSNSMRAVLDPERYGQAFVESYATSLIPKIVGQPTTMTDPYKREVDGALEAIQSQLPYFREQLLPKRDRWGEPAKNNRWFDVMPVAVSKESTDKVKTEAMRLQIAIADAPKYAEEKGPFKAGEKRTELTDVQRDIFRQVAGGKAQEFLRPIVNSEDWERIPAFAQVKIYEEVLRRSRDFAKWEALPPDSPARIELRRKIVDRIVRDTQEVAAPEKRIKAE